MESAHHFSSSPDCSNTADVPSFTRERLFQPCHLSRIDKELKCGESMKNLHMLSQIPSSCLWKSFRSVRRVQQCWQTFFRLMWRFCFARIRLNPLSGKILYHGSVPVIVSGFTSLIEDFVIRRNQITILFCTKKSFANVSSAKSLCHFGSQADVAISLFREVSENTVPPWFCCHFHKMFQVWFPRTVCGCENFFHQIFFELLNHSKIFANESSASFLPSLFYW